MLPWAIRLPQVPTPILRLSEGRWPCELTHWLAPLFLKAPMQRRLEISQAIKDANSEIVALADEFPNLTVVTALGEESPSAEEISEVDCIHPSALGQQRIADAFISALQQRLEME